MSPIQQERSNVVATWMVRAGRGGVLVDAFLEHKNVSINFGAQDIGPIDPTTTRDSIASKLRAVQPNAKAGAILVAASQVQRFSQELRKGDRVVTGDPGRRRYLIGKITSDARFEEQRYMRSVEWTHRAPRDALTVQSRNSLGAIQTLFRLNDDVVADFESHMVPIDAVETGPPPEPKVQPAEGPSIHELTEEAAEKAQEFIEDSIAKLDPYEMQDLVAGILRAMGYKTRVSDPGADRGVDIFASPDGLGLEEPRIFVEVKHRKVQMRADELRAFLGGRRPGDRCLYVSTGGFSKDARYEADRSSVPLTLLDLPALRELLLEHYERLDTETRQLVPLRRLYFPLADE